MNGAPAKGERKLRSTSPTFKVTGEWADELGVPGDMPKVGDVLSFSWVNKKKPNLNSTVDFTKPRA